MIKDEKVLGLNLLYGNEVHAKGTQFATHANFISVARSCRFVSLVKQILFCTDVFT
jgi:hypothetical protein